MVLPGHLAGGYLATRVLLAVFHPGLSSVEIDSLFIIGTLGGELPDVDLISFYFNQKSKTSKKVADHRSYLTHIPLVWFAVSLIIVVYGLTFDSMFVQFLGWTILAGTWSHFILDSIEYGVRWLWPFSDKTIAMRTINDNSIYSSRPGTIAYYWEFITKTYTKTLAFYVEIGVTFAALWMLVRWLVS